jgi:hypothetical protein
MRYLLLLIFLSLLIRTNAQTVGWFYNEEGSLPGYVLFAANPSDTTYLIDKCGKRVHQWGTPGKGPSQFAQPHGIAIDSQRERAALLADARAELRAGA